MHSRPPRRASPQFLPKTFSRERFCAPLLPVRGLFRKPKIAEIPLVSMGVRKKPLRDVVQNSF